MSPPRRVVLLALSPSVAGSKAIPVGVLGIANI